MPSTSPETPELLQSILTRLEEFGFWAIRGNSIQSYANLEQAQCRLFGSLAGTTDLVAGIIFFRINSFRIRDAIMEKLFQRKFGQEYSEFRNSLIKQLGPIHIERNEIVHWNAVIERAPDKTEKKALRPPNFFQEQNTEVYKDAPSIIAFGNKCVFYRNLIHMFTRCHFDDPRSMSQDERGSWLDIFRGPIIYPPPETHPLFQAISTPETQLPPFPA